MTVWVLLLRGINVGGHNKLPMAELRVLLEDLGACNVATYIQSGNAVFSGEGGTENWREKIQRAILDTFGFSPDVFLFSRDTFSAALDHNPFNDAVDDPKTLHLCFLQGSVSKDVMENLGAAATRQEEMHLGDGVLYLFTPNGFGRSDVAGKMNRIIKVPMTARNLRSCEKIRDLAAKI